MAALALALVAGSTVQHAGLSDASAGIALDDSHFIVANDEHNRLVVYRRGLVQPVHEVDVGGFLNPPDRESFAVALGRALAEARRGGPDLATAT